MINGPDHCQLNKMDTLIIALGLQVAIRQGMMIEEEIDDDEEDEEEEENEAEMDIQVEGELEGEVIEPKMEEEMSERDAPESVRSSQA